MSSHISRRVRVGALHAVELENEWLRLQILPEVGAKIYELFWKKTRQDILWHNPRVLPQTYPIESDFDNYWCGGWDDGFPTCDECVLDGQRYPNLGELRSVRWTLESARREGGNMVARFAAFGPISPVRAVKQVTLEGHVPVVRMRYEITNLGPGRVDFLWGTHPAVAISEHTILRIPAQRAMVGQCNNPAMGQAGQLYDWPILQTESGPINMSQVQVPQANLCFGHYAMNLEDGWYAIEDTKSQTGFMLSFPLEQCPNLWLWLNYGGWRGHYHVIVEPWTSVPVNLTHAVEQKTSRRLEPGEKFSVEVKATVYRKPETWEDALARLHG